MNTLSTMSTRSPGETAGPGPDAAVIHLEKIHKVYHTGTVDVHALHGISLTVRKGEFLAIMGPSGSGKSTMMNIIGCLDRPTKGRYYLDGVDVSTLSKSELADVRNRQIGFVFQAYNLVPRTSVLENVELPLLYAGVPHAERVRRAREALVAVNLLEKEASLPNQLSGGQQQRVAIARSLVNNPSIILADEPTGNLDTRTSIEVMEILQRFNMERDLTIVIVTHENDIALYAKRATIFRDGRISQDYQMEKRSDAHAVLATMPMPEEEEEDNETLGNS